jgi:apolipoprotein D and lipocalin family protein
MIRLTLVAAALAAAVSGPAGAQVRSLDLDRFDGRWFEIERTPNDVQKTCWRAQIDFTAQQRADRYRVLVTCTRTRGGPVETLRANAQPLDQSNARLRFTLDGLLGFGGLARQTYWVLDHDPAYRWSILSLPNKADWWIWHRDADVPQAERSRLLARARSLGLDTQRVVRTPPAD